VSRRRWATTVLVGVLLGFFAGVVAVQLGGEHTQVIERVIIPPDAGAAKASAATRATATFGAAQAETHKAGVTKPPIVPFIRTLSLGTHGDGTKQLQQALVRAKLRPARAKATGYYGPITARQVLTFQRKTRGLTPSGVFGHPTLLKLSKFYTAAMRGELQAIARAHAVAKWQAAILRDRAQYARAAIAGRAHYSQGIERGFFPNLVSGNGLLAPSWLDCSSYVTWLYSRSGAAPSGISGRLPDPNGFGYSPVGYTGTLARHGVRVSINAALRVGDLVFYGGGYPYGHVAIVVDAFRRLVSSHGQPGVRTVPFNYRPVSAIRRYF
jgi:peptidoglycan hydrolase-like protein with peptidoglycan-binding domain